MKLLASVTEVLSITMRTSELQLHERSAFERRQKLEGEGVFYDDSGCLSLTLAVPFPNSNKSEVGVTVTDEFRFLSVVWRLTPSRTLSKSLH